MVSQQGGDFLQQFSEAVLMKGTHKRNQFDNDGLISLADALPSVMKTEAKADDMLFS